MSKHPSPPALRLDARLGATALGVSLLAVTAGALPVAGLGFRPPARPATPTVTPPVTPTPGPAPAPVVVEAIPAQGPELPGARGVAEDGPVRLEAALARRVLLHGEGRVDLAVGVTVAPAPATQRDPIDLALVVDTSASMSGVIGLVKRATLDAIARLGDRDRLVLVTYADEARVVYSGPVTGEARQALERAVAGFVAARGTNIGDGVTTGIAGLRALPDLGCRGVRARPRRLVLLSDGAPTVGETDPRALAALPQAARGSVAFSCVGLGTAYQEGLLARIADAGGGAFHHVDGPAALERVYAAELDAMRTLALRGALLRIAPAPGVEVEGVTAWDHAREGAATTVALGDLSHGRRLQVIVRLKVAASQGGADVRDVVSVRLTGRPEQELVRELALDPGCLRVALTDDPAAAEAARVAEVEAAVREADVADRLGAARAAAARGEAQRARALVHEARELAGQDEVTFVAPSGEAQALSLGALADDLAEGERTDRGRRALKVTMAAERAVGR